MRRPLRTVNGAVGQTRTTMLNQPEAVSISESRLPVDDLGDFTVDCPAHSVTVLNLT